ncbi:MAG: hypothetical protein ACR2LV_04475 [Solirubrobacteraceae bacterium]
MEASDGRRHAALRRSGEGLLVAALSVLGAAWALRLWRGDLALPLRYTPLDDTKFYLMLVKGILEHGSYLHNPSLGIPFGQQLYDYPQGADNLNLLIIRGLGLFTANPALVVNLFLLLSFALASFTSYLVLRALGLAACGAGVASVLFSLLAYHFFRGESHLLLSAYYAVPLSAYLFLRLLADAPLFTSGRLRGWASGRSLATVGLCVVVGSESLYYATFTEVLLAVAVIAALVRRRWRTAVAGAAIVALVAATLAVNLAPSLIYRMRHGANPVVERSAAANESSNQALGLSLGNLILPAPGSHSPVLRQVATRYDHAIAPGYCEACYASLGAVGTVGLAWLALCALGALVGVSGGLGARALLRHAGAGVVSALAVGTAGGLSIVFERFVTPDIRAWNRISVLIAFFSLLAAGVLLDSLLRWLGTRRGGRALATVALAGVLALGVYDQTSASFIPAYSATARQYRSDRVFVGEIEARLPHGAGVFQLPYVPFPEGYPKTRPGDQVATYATKYELLRGYLHSSTLRWSYGAIKGRPGNWAAQLAGQPLSFVVAAVGAAGFDGIWVDPAGFEAAKARQVRTALVSLLGETPLVSPDADLWFFDLRPYLTGLVRSYSQAQLTLLRDATLHPLRTACAAGGLTLINPSPAARAVTLTVHLLSGAVGNGVTSRRGLRLAPGRSFVRIAHVSFATLTDDALMPFARAGGRLGGALVVGLTGPACAT